MDQAVRDWFSHNHHSTTVLNVFTVSMIISETESQEEDMSGPEKLKYAKSIYSDIVDMIVKDGKINQTQGLNLTNQYSMMDNNGMIDEFAIIVSDLTNQPNLINIGKWIRDNKCGQVRNKCFPCKIVSNIKK